MARSLPSKLPRRYNRLFLLLHWGMAALIFAMLALGFLLEEFPSGSAVRGNLFAWHMSIGLSILLLVLFRIAWRASHAVPPQPQSLPKPLRAFARMTHYLLYLLMLGMPLMGWMMVSSRPRPDGWLTLVFSLPWPQIPGFAEHFGAWRPWLGDLHWYGAWGVIGLVALHAGAALMHHFLLRDDTLLRMLPQRWHPAFHRLRGSVR